MATKAEQEDGFGKGHGRGGARHFAKPYVDSGLVYKVLSEHQETLHNLGPYEHCSRANAPDPKGLVKTLPLWKGLLRLESSGEIHAQPMRTALISLLADAPELNSTKYSGQVWVNLKLERINTILYHVRKLGGESLTAAAAKLTREEYTQLQQGLKLLDCGALEKAHVLEKASALEKARKKTPAEECTAMLPFEGHLSGKTCLKKNDSDATMDSQGFPRMFGESPAKASPNPSHEPPAAPTFTRRRAGSKATPLEKGELHEALGFGAMKKPAAALGKAKKEDGKPALEKVKEKKLVGILKNKKATSSLEKEVRKPWLKIRKTAGAAMQFAAGIASTTHCHHPWFSQTLVMQLGPTWTTWSPGRWFSKRPLGTQALEKAPTSSKALEKAPKHSLQQGFGKGFAQDTRPKGFGKGTPRHWKRPPKALEKAMHACIEPSWPKMGRLDVLLREICEEKYYYES